jgi:hypothetical protein
VTTNEPLSADEPEEPTATERGTGPGINRRTLVTGAAWSIPVIALAVNTPAAAASGNNCYWTEKTRVESSQDNTIGRDMAYLDVPVPPGAQQMGYYVVGALGARAYPSGSVGGQSAAISGTTPIGPYAGVNLRLIAGSRGVQRFGGAGYGNGGYGTIPWGGNESSTTGGLGGGAGSAILFGDQPLVVAGGSGGGGRANAQTGVTYYTNGGSGSAGLIGGTAAGGANWIRTNSGGGDVSWAYGGSGASASGSGIGGDYGGQRDNGNSGVQSPGRDGGGGAGPSDPWSSDVSGAGGGGGGYYGGGGGATIFWKGLDNRWTQFGGAGGGGSSFVDPTISGASSQLVSPSGGNGYVEVWFYVCD